MTNHQEWPDEIRRAAEGSTGITGAAMSYDADADVETRDTISK